MGTTTSQPRPAAAARPRLAFLDGIRALAALFVVAHHIYITVYPDFPANGGPWALGWLLYGHFGVAVFIVVSGFSLTLAPTRHDDDLGGFRRFMRRRAWRIIPPYWAALFFSVVIVAGLVNLRIDYPLTVKGVLTHFFLVQDIVSGPAPNGAFWSIAVEWQLYFLFPLFLLARRHLGGAATAVGGALGIWIVYQLAVGVRPLDRLLHLSPQFAALFVFGIVAAGATRPRDETTRRARRVPWGWISLALWAVVLAGCGLAGSTRVDGDLYWADLVVGAAMAASLAAFVGTGSATARRPLESRPLVAVGHFSYSLYLIHAPILLVGWLFLVQPMELSDNASFVVMVGLIGPVILAISYGFFLLFERPFLTARSLSEVRHQPLPWASSRSRPTLAAPVPSSTPPARPPRQVAPASLLEHLDGAEYP